MRRRGANFGSAMSRARCGLVPPHAGRAVSFLLEASQRDAAAGLDRSGPMIADLQASQILQLPSVPGEPPASLRRACSGAPSPHSVGLS